MGSARAVFVSVALLALAGSVTATAQTNFENQVTNQLNAGKNLLEGQGHTLVFGPLTGSLNRNATKEHSVTLIRGGEYTMVGVCDHDCSDVDLKVFDPRGDLVSQDLLVDDAPVVSMKATRTGRYRIQVIMAACSAAPCYYGVNIFAK